MQKTNQQKFRVEKMIKRKRDKLFVKWKGFDSSFNSWINKKDLVYYCSIKMSQYFRNSNFSKSNYPAKKDFKSISHVHTSNFALKTNLANLKTEVDKLDIDKLVPVPVDLGKLSDLVKNGVGKKDVYDKLVAKVDIIATSVFVLKTKYHTDKSELDNKIPDTSGLPKKTDYDSKITDIEGKTLDISGLATKTIINYC